MSSQSSEACTAHSSIEYLPQHYHGGVHWGQHVPVPTPAPAPAPTHNAMANVHVSRMMPKVDLGGRRLQHHPPPSPLSRHWLPGAVCTCCQGCNCTRWPSVAERTVVDPARSGLPANGGHAAAAADRHGAEHPILGQPSGRGLLHRPCRHDADRATGPERLRGLGTWKP